LEYDGDVLPGNPSKVSVTRASQYRPAIPKVLTEIWEEAILVAREWWLVPVTWNRPLDNLPVERSLEAWFLWTQALGSADWQVKPDEVLASTGANYFHHRSLMHPAKLDSHTGSVRLSCDLLIDLSKRSGNFVWIAPETTSVSVWTDFAYQAWFGNLAAD
jgi:hypothetical protein